MWILNNYYNVYDFVHIQILFYAIVALLFSVRASHGLKFWSCFMIIVINCFRIDFSFSLQFFRIDFFFDF
jgi:hypothetical protein